MGSLTELEKLLRQKEDRIRELEYLLKQRDTDLEELRSKLDKFQSVMPHGGLGAQPWTKPGLLKTKVRARRGVGISAEPQSLKSIEDLVGEEFKKYPKDKR